MTSLKKTHPRYRQIASQLRQDLAGRRYAIGEKLPPVRELASSHNCSLTTIQLALRELDREGLLDATPRGNIRLKAFPASDGRNGRIVCVFPQWESLAEESFAAQFMLGVGIAARPAGFAVEALPYQNLAELNGLRDRLRREPPAGVIWANAPDPVLTTQLEDAGVRLVTILRHDPRVASPYTADDFAQGFAAMIAAWQQRGIRHPGILAMGTNDPTYEPALQTLLAQLNDGGMPVPPEHLCRARVTGLDNAGRQILLHYFQQQSAHMDAIYSFAPDTLGEAIELAQNCGDDWRQRLFLATHSARSIPIPFDHARLESNIRQHAHRAVELLQEWLLTGQRPKPVLLPMAWLEK